MRSMYVVSSRSNDSSTLRVTRMPVKSAGCPGPYLPTCGSHTTHFKLTAQWSAICVTLVIKSYASGHSRSGIVTVLAFMCRSVLAHRHTLAYL